MKRLQKNIVKMSSDIARAISEECSRPLTESISQEVIATLETIHFLTKNIRKWIKPRKMRYLRPGFMRKSNIVYRMPIGTIAVITPYNFPFSLAMMTLVYLLLAGNTVILKPSEHSSKVAPLMNQLLHDSGLSPRAANIIQGDGDTGKWLVEQPEIKKVFFFGRRETGKKIARICCQYYKPYVLELGGGTISIVCKDARLELAGAGIAWSGFNSGGRSCIATEKVFVDESVLDDFIKIVKKNLETTAVKQCAVYNPDEAERTRQLIDDALLKKAVLISGGKITKRKDGNYDIDNTILLHITPEMKLFKQEIFGPVIGIIPFSQKEDCLSLVKQSYQPLGVSIWSRSKKNVQYFFSCVEASMFWANDSSFGLPSLPWAGWNEAGWGSVYSEFAIHEATKIKWVSTHPSAFALKRFWWYPYTKLKEKFLSFISRYFY